MTQFDEATEDLSELLAEIAANLEALSQIESTPSGFKRRLSPQTAAAIIEGLSTSWLEVTLQEQEWLWLDDGIDTRLFREEPRAAAMRVFELLGARGNDAATCLEDSDGPAGPLLSIKGASLLSERLEDAVRHAQSFLDALGDESKSAATEHWEEAWNSEASDSEQPSPITAETSTKNILDVTTWADRKQLVLSPSYQRDDVWPHKTAQELIESILRGIPLPSIVLLKLPAKNGRAPTFEVVDGKQRLTSILRFIGAHPKARDAVRQIDAEFPDKGFKSLFQSNYPRFRALWNDHRPTDKLTARRERELMMPFKLRRGTKLGRIEMLRECEGKYYSDIRDVEISSDRTTVSDIFEKGSDYKLAVITFSGSTPRQIHEVFKLYNRQGKKLNAEELRNAVHHELDLTRAMLAASEAGQDVDRMMPSASSEFRASLVSIFKSLNDEDVPRGRFGKFKLLGWTLATTFALEQNGSGLLVRSTADQINYMLERCAGKDPGAATSSPAPFEALTRFAGLEVIFRSLARGTSLMLGVPMWDDDFKYGKQNSWQDLQFVAAQTAMLIGSLTLGEAFEDRVEAKATQVKGRTSKLVRPEKSQNRSQWAFIGHAVVSILDALDIAPSAVSAAFQNEFGSDPMPALDAASAIWTKEYAKTRAGQIP